MERAVNPAQVIYPSSTGPAPELHSHEGPSGPRSFALNVNKPGAFAFLLRGQTSE